MAWVKQEVYGAHPIETEEARPLEEVVPVDLKIFGCPIKKEEVEKVVTNLVVGKRDTCKICLNCDTILILILGSIKIPRVTDSFCQFRKV